LKSISKLLRSISSGAQYAPAKSKMDEENPTCTGLTQENGFASS